MSSESDPNSQFGRVLKEIGGFGPWQRRMAALLWVPSVYAGMWFMIYPFVLATPKEYRCVVPGCESGSGGDPITNASWLDRAIPKADDGSYERCLRHPRTDRNAATCDPGDFLTTGAEKCPQGEMAYDQSVYTSTGVTEFGLVCDRLHLKSAIGMVFALCYGFGSTLWGWAADTYGRKVITLGSVFLGATFTLACSFSSSYTMLFATYIISGLCVNGAYITPFILTVELVGKDKAALCSQLINFPFVAGELLTVLAAYLFRDFREMLRAAFVPTYLFLAIGFFVPESPRWLLANDRTDAAKRVLLKAAKSNGREISPERLDEILNQNEDVEDSKEEEEKEEVTMWEVVKNPCMRKRLSIMCLNWIAAVLCYQGLILNSVNLKGNVFLNMALGISIEVPSYLLIMFTVDRFGRRPVLVSTHLLASSMSAVALAIQFFASSDTSPLYVVLLATVAKFGTTAAFALIILQNMELFPTNVRTTCMGVCNLAGRIGAVLAPFITNLPPGYELVPMALFALVSLLAGVSAMFISETRGQELPATIQEAEERDNSLKC